jgi:hypothetical protein
MVLSQPGIMPAKMLGQQGAESAWQLPASLRAVNSWSAGYRVCLSAENLQGVTAALKLPVGISATYKFTQK